MNDPQHLYVTDENGIPSAVVDVDALQTQAVRLAYDMAANSSDPGALEAVSARHLAEASPAAFGYVCAAALRMLTEHILEPTLQACDAAGVHLRTGLADAARNATENL